jgi:hypothetical protein
MAYRVYKAVYPFTARDQTELSMMPGDLLHVGMLDDGTWPNENAWMKGTNQTSRLTGDFPGGSYSVLIDEVNPQPPVQEKAPTPPPRRARGVSPRVDNDQHRGGAVVSPTRKRSHDVFKVTLHLPVLCVVCGDYVWGSACTGYKCQFCLSLCHETCLNAFMKDIECNINEESEDSSRRDYVYTVTSFHEFKEADIEEWMKAVNIDVYWEIFKRGGITNGRQLQNITTPDHLNELGITDDHHIQVILQCLNELCISTQVSTQGLSDDQTDIGAWKRLSGQFAIGMNRSPSIVSEISGKEAKKKMSEIRLNGHVFTVNSYATLTRCDNCTRYMLGLFRQGMKCNGEP